MNHDEPLPVWSRKLYEVVNQAIEEAKKAKTEQFVYRKGDDFFFYPAGNFHTLRISPSDEVAIVYTSGRVKYYGSFENFKHMAWQIERQDKAITLPEAERTMENALVTVRGYYDEDRTIVTTVRNIRGEHMGDNSGYWAGVITIDGKEFPAVQFGELKPAIDKWLGNAYREEDIDATIHIEDVVRSTSTGSTTNNMARPR